MCRRKKIKCNWRTPSCSHCVRYKTTCIYTPSQRPKRTPRKRYRVLFKYPSFRVLIWYSAKGSDNLERRLAHVESALGLRASPNPSSDSSYATNFSGDMPAGLDSTTRSHDLVQSTSVSYSSPILPVYGPTIGLSLPQTTANYNYTSSSGMYA